MGKGMSQGQDIFERYELTRVINVAGTKTSVGASMITPQAMEAGAGIGDQFVSIDQLQARAGRVIAGLTGAEAGFITACSAAGIVLGVAGCMTGCNLAKIERLPDTTGMKDEVVVQSGHLINYGAPVEQAIRTSGAMVVPVGSAALAEVYHLDDCIGDRTAAALYVVSHHTVQEGQIPMTDFIACCHGRGVPVIVDMASEYDLQTPAALGAELVIYSSHKFLSGPTAGIIAGKKESIRAAYLQNRGLGRPMKVGKEGIVGAMAALEAWEQRNHEAVHQKELGYVAFWFESLQDAAGLELWRHRDWTGNPIDRVKVTVDPQRAGLYAWELADRLAAGKPAVHVRDDLIEHGYFFLDPCNLKPGQEKVVTQRIKEEIEKALTKGDGRAYDYSRRRQQAIESILRWPDI